MHREHKGDLSVSAGPGVWSEAVARRRAREAGLGELGEEHWRLIHTLREHFIQYGAVPPAQLACSVNHLQPHCLEQLFHDRDGAWRIAGLSTSVDEGYPQID